MRKVWIEIRLRPYNKVWFLLGQYSQNSHQLINCGLRKYFILNKSDVNRRKWQQCFISDVNWITLSTKV